MQKRGRTDHHTYPSKNVEEEGTLEKRTDVRGNHPTRKPVLQIPKHGPGLHLIAISSGGTNRQESSHMGKSREAAVLAIIAKRCVCERQVDVPNDNSLASSLMC